MISGEFLISLPILIPLLGALLTGLGYGRGTFLRTLLLLAQLAASLALLAQGTVASAIGNWLAPYGVVLISDPFSGLLLSCASLIFLCCLWDHEANTPASASLLFLLQCGVSLSFLTGDLFNLFVAFELMLMSSYGLMAIYADKTQVHRAFSYLLVNVLASMFFLIAMALLYGYTGTLNLAAAAEHYSKLTFGVSTIPVLFLLIVMFVKGAVFPFYFWLPDSYPMLPARLAALFAGILSKVGIYVAFRLLLFLMPSDAYLMQPLLMTLGCLTMLLGVFGAVSRSSVPGILCYHVLSQVGYILCAAALSTYAAVAAGVFFIVHNMIVKSSLLLLGGLAGTYCGSVQLKQMRGLWQSRPFLGVLFLLQAFALAGLPPLSGFWGKYLLFLEGIRSEAYIMVTLGSITSFFTLFSMIKIWKAAFQGKAMKEQQKAARTAYIGPVILTALALVMGIFAQLSVGLAEDAADALFYPDSYLAASLNSGSKGATP